MRFDVVRTVFVKELREMLRDRRSLAVMFGLPLVLYPLLAIGIAALSKGKRDAGVEQAARVVFAGDPESAPELFQKLREPDRRIELVLPPDPRAALTQGQIDAVLEVPPNFEARARRGEDVAIGLWLNRSLGSAEFAERKLNGALDDYNQWIIERRLSDANVTQPKALLRPIKRTVTDIATGQQRFGRILSQMVPMLLLMTGMLGALFPALNATTTERELGTLETLLVTPVGRAELLLGKGLLVLACALLTAGLNMLSMSLVLLRVVSQVAGPEVQGLKISPGAIALTYLAAVPALIFFTAIVLIVGLLARNFREANSFATPTMLLPLVSLAVGIAEPASSPGLLITPVANTTVIIRDVLTGHVSVSDYVLAFASSCLYAGLVLSVAARVFSSEQLVNPAWEPLSLRGFKRGGGGGGAARVPARRVPAIDAALALFCASLLLIFYVTPSVIRYGLIPTAVANQVLLILTPALLFAWLGRWDWRETFKLRRPPLGALAGGALLGIGLGPLARLFRFLQDKVWPSDARSMQAEAELVLDALQRHPVLTIVTIALLAGICEEMLFRGPIQTALVRNRRSPWPGLLVGALLFAAMHMNLQGVPLRMLLGLLLGWIVWRCGSIFPAMAMHVLYDATQLTTAVWMIRRHGGAALTEATAAPPFGAEEWVQVCVGAGLVVAGWFLCRAAFRKRPSRVAAADNSPGREPWEADARTPIS